MLQAYNVYYVWYACHHRLVDETICKNWSSLYSYKAGAGQTFSQPDHILCGSQMIEVREPECGSKHSDVLLPVFCNSLCKCL